MWVFTFAETLISKFNFYCILTSLVYCTESLPPMCFNHLNKILDVKSNFKNLILKFTLFWSLKLCCNGENTVLWHRPWLPEQRYKTILRFRRYIHLQLLYMEVQGILLYQGFTKGLPRVYQGFTRQLCMQNIQTATRDVLVANL